MMSEACDPRMQRGFMPASWADQRFLPQPGHVCRSCNGTRFWTRQRQGWCCLTCHPPPPDEHEITDLAGTELDAGPPHVRGVRRDAVPDRPAVPAVRAEGSRSEAPAQRSEVPAARTPAKPEPKPRASRVDPIAPVRYQGMLL
jgi:hypothetical protein